MSSVENFVITTVTARAVCELWPVTRGLVARAVVRLGADSSIRLFEAPEARHGRVWQVGCLQSDTEAEPM